MGAMSKPQHTIRLRGSDDLDLRSQVWLLCLTIVVAERRTAPIRRPEEGSMHHQFRKLAAAGLAFYAVLLTSACSKSRHEGTELYYLVASNIKLPYWQAALAGLGRAGTELTVRAEMVGPDVYDAKAQRDFFKDVVAKKPSGIMISAADPELMKPEIDAAIAAGIPVITMD